MEKPPGKDRTTTYNLQSTIMFKHITAIVSGGASGLGGATASYLTRHGARVVVADLPQAKDNFLRLEASVSEQGNGSLTFANTDVRSEDDVTSALDMAVQQFGEQGEHVYCLCTMCYYNIYILHIIFIYLQYPIFLDAP